MGSRALRLDPACCDTDLRSSSPPLQRLTGVWAACPNTWSAARPGVKRLVVQTPPAHAGLVALVPGVLTRWHAFHFLGFTANPWKRLEKEENPGSNRCQTPSAPS